MFESLQDKLSEVFRSLSSKGTLSQKDTEEALKAIRIALIEADVSLPIVKDFIERVKTKAIGQEIIRSIQPGQMVVKIVHDELIATLGKDHVGISLNAPAPVVIMLVGLQGSGKTTTSAKLAAKLRKQHNKKILLASLDTYRPAAQEQLEQLAKQLNIDSLEIIKGQNVTDITHRALKAGSLGGYDVIILDTAGRNTVDEPLMQELDQVKKIAQPHEILLVADSLTGQEAVNIAQAFNERVSLTGIILTKIDGDGRGGAALSMRSITGVPIKAVGTGEKTDQLEDFIPSRIADRILGMGDIVGLVEKAAENIDKIEAEKLAKKIKKGKFDFNDLATQLQQMKKLGGLGTIMNMIPGLSKIKDQALAAGINDDLIKRQLAIISSMTPYERENPDILKHSRKQRIAKGSGTDAAQINKLIKMHKQMADMMKAMGGGKSRGGLFNKMMGLGGLANPTMNTMNPMNPMNTMSGLGNMPTGNLTNPGSDLPQNLSQSDLDILKNLNSSDINNIMNKFGSMPNLPGIKRKK